jgi:endoglucanase
MTALSYRTWRDPRKQGFDSDGAGALSSQRQTKASERTHYPGFTPASAAVAAALLVALAGCASEAEPTQSIKLNQLGFPPAAQKLAVVPGAATGRFDVRSADGVTALVGELATAQHWPFSDETVRVADLSAVHTPGLYVLEAEGAGESPPFEIRPNVQRPLAVAALKAFYFARSRIDLVPEVAGVWARAGGHPDDEVIVHSSAASASRPAGSIIASPGGWYDAGDYNKYIVNASFATATLLAAYEHHPGYFARLEAGIPESGDEVPDVIDEAVFNLGWIPRTVVSTTS